MRAERPPAMNSTTISLDPAAAAKRATLDAGMRAAALPLALFSLAHFFIDLYSGALGALQPLLIAQFGITLTQAGLLGGMLVFSGSVMQPVYGYFSDRTGSRLFTVLAPAAAGVFISSLGWAPSYLGLLAMVFLGAAGIGSFHPQATANAALGVKANPGRAMAAFISAGTLGMALGPTYFSFVTGRWGLRLMPWAAVPGIAVSVLLWLFLPPVHGHAGTRPKFDAGPLRAVWKPMTILYFLVVIRSVVQITFTQFLPLYLTVHRGYTLAAASYVTSLYLAGGALGGFMGGNIADRIGGRTVILISMLGSIPFLALFVFTKGIWSIAALVAGGLVLLFTIPVNVVMGQRLAPAQAGTVSALMMGAAWGMAGMVFIPLTGWIADHYSMQYAFAGLIAFPFIGFILALWLPKRAGLE
ncbi:MAG: MFS transporter [Bryobacterales bacterium]|nr:MFS transporter [Bryobacterales bacterium]